VNAKLIKLPIILCLCFVVSCSRGVGFRSFPTEAEVNANLRHGMTPQQVVALFGEPFNGRPPYCINCQFRYLAPSGMRTVEREGYQGFEVQFEEGKVRSWRIYTGSPSYNPSMPMPSLFKWELRILGILIILGIMSGLLLRVTPIGIQKYNDVFEAFAAREISTQRLPPEFQFITHEKTLQEVIDRLGPFSREAWLPVDAEAGLGGVVATTNSGKGAILTFEYHLPYNAAVVVMPEYPFKPENRIRAVFYRAVQRELAESRYSEQ
jgi:hypothetical protein